RLATPAARPARPRRAPVWPIAAPERELDPNLLRLPAGDSIPAHVGAEVDTLIHVVRGDGALVTQDGEEPLRAGDVALLPRRTVRGFRAGEDGLEYLTVHRRRQSLQIKSGPTSA